MIEIGNECVGCDLPCIYEACPYWAVVRMYCDECKDENQLYWWDNKQLCLGCIEAQLERVEYNEDE